MILIHLFFWGHLNSKDKRKLEFEVYGSLRINSKKQGHVTWRISQDHQRIRWGLSFLGEMVCTKFDLPKYMVDLHCPIPLQWILDVMKNATTEMKSFIYMRCHPNHFQTIAFTNSLSKTPKTKQAGDHAYSPLIEQIKFYY